MKRYWFCVVEVDLPNQFGGLPDGADLPMRKAVKSTIEDLGVGPVVELFSGWGLSETGAKTIKLESIMPINND